MQSFALNIGQGIFSCQIAFYIENSFLNSTVTQNRERSSGSALLNPRWTQEEFNFLLNLTNKSVSWSSEDRCMYLGDSGNIGLRQSALDILACFRQFRFLTYFSRYVCSRNCIECVSPFHLWNESWQTCPARRITPYCGNVFGVNLINK